MQLESKLTYTDVKAVLYDLGVVEFGIIYIVSSSEHLIFLKIQILLIKVNSINKDNE